MPDTMVIDATMRQTLGKGPARAARREGRIPAVIYGDGKPAAAVTIAAKELLRHLHAGGFHNTLFNVQVDGQSIRVLPRDVQLHPVTDMPEHVDFLRVSADTAVTVEVPVEFLNEEHCPGLRAGGVLNVVRYNIEVSCRSDQIPTSIPVDLGSAELGDSLHISAVNLPIGVTPAITDRDFTIVTIAAPTVAAETSEVEDDADGADPDADADG